MSVDDAPATVIAVQPGLRLRAFDPDSASPALLAELLTWYQDAETLTMVDGPGAQPYDPDKLLAMYRHLRDHGELYLIEQHRPEQHRPEQHRPEQHRPEQHRPERYRPERYWDPIGEICLQERAIPLVLAPGHRGRGVGGAVLRTMIDRARHLGWRTVRVSDIYTFNTASRRLFEGQGFRVVARTEHGHSYVLTL